MDLGLHLPLMRFGDEPLSRARLDEAVDAARQSGFAAITANDHFLFSTPWLDGPTALASVVERSGEMDLATTITLVVLRGPVALAKTLTAIDILSSGRLIAGVGPGSSKADYDALGIPFEDRWARFEEAVRSLRALLTGESELVLEPSPPREGGIPIWIGSWGSDAGLRRVARLADGWLASAYNTTPDGFAASRAKLPDGFPNALATMWTWVSRDREEGDRVLRDVLAPLLRRDPEELRGQVCVGPVEHCAHLLSRYSAAGCQRVYLWPLGDERRQIELVGADVAPQIEHS